MNVKEEVAKIHWPKTKEVLASARTTIAVITVYALIFAIEQILINAL
ncbi:MAG: preprotein translocase subunit SecE [Erysipelotrichaceae bacterium]|nr:preprotein translocase subunit SecE [Erysipelotrichaceae bacterium]